MTGRTLIRLYGLKRAVGGGLINTPQMHESTHKSLSDVQLSWQEQATGF
jgi:hypothetical protein